MAEVIRVGAPGDFQVREDIAVIDRKDRLTGLANVLRARSGKVWIALLIKTDDSAGSFSAVSACSVVAFKTSIPFLLMRRGDRVYIAAGGALSKARSGRSKAWVGRLWQYALHLNVANVLAEPAGGPALAGSF